MNARHEKLPVASLERIDDLCVEFEVGLRSGGFPTIEATLNRVETEKERSALLAELLLLDVDYRRKRGDVPHHLDYIDRFPDDEAIINRVLKDTNARTSPIHFEPPTVERLAQLFPTMEILELIGAGGMGAVYKARQKGLDRLVAVKILPDEVSHDTKFAMRFTREARVLARLNHPNIVSVYEFGQSAGTYFFVMEFIDGPTLRDVIKTHELEPAQALKIVPHLCDALQYAHDQGVVHRDIKPENILLDQAGQVKIADFGLSRILGNETQEHALTGTHQVMGTLRYMAPEQMEGSHRVDHRADIYSLGVVFYEMLTGELPLGRFAVPSERVKIDVRLDEVVLRTLEKEPQRRYQRASQVKSDLQTIASSSGHPPLSKASVSQQSPSKSPAVASLEQQELAARVLLMRRELFAKVENSLTPLFWGQIIQMLFGVVFIALGVACWAPHQDIPHRLISGIVLHVYGTIMVISAGVTCSRVKRLDSTQPVDSVRQQLGKIRRFYLVSGIGLGFSWWLLWIPLAVAVRFDAVVYPPGLLISVAIGVVGMALSLGVIWFAYRMPSATPEKWNRALAGESLRNANLALDEIAKSELS